MLFDVLKIMLKFAKTVEIENTFYFTEVKTKGIWVDLEANNILPRVNLCIYIRQISVEKTTLQCCTALEIV